MVADVRIVEGPAMIQSENGMLRNKVQLSVRDRDVVGFVEDARRVVAQKVKLPQGMYLEWSGQFENQVRAGRTMLVVFPAVILVIFIILYLTYNDLIDALLMMKAVPEAMVGTEFDQIWQRLEADRKEGRQDEDDKGKDDDTLKAEYRAIAERRVRLGLLLAEIGRANNITVSPDEMMRAMQAEAARFPGQEAAVIDFFHKNPRSADTLRGPIFEDKVIDFILELAKVSEREVTMDELRKDPDAAPAEPAEVEDAKPKRKSRKAAADKE